MATYSCILLLEALTKPYVSRSKDTQSEINLQLIVMIAIN